MTATKAIVTIGEELAGATAILAAAGIDTPQLDAEVLMARVVGASRVHVISHPTQRLRRDELLRFQQMVERRARREPLAYITGEKEFWGLAFEVGPRMLVPRPETEILVEAALEQLSRVGNPLVADIGAGTGCIAVALAAELPDAVVYATEASPEAAEVAGRNAAKHQVDLRVVILAGNLLHALPEDLEGRLDAVVSNPPCVRSDELESLQPEISRYEPREALDGGPDGMKYHRLILEAAKGFLKPGGWVHLEVGVGQAKHVAAHARSLGYRETRITDDLAGLERVVSCEL